MQNRVVRILLTLIALGALGLSFFLLTRQQDGVTLNTVGATLMYGGFVLSLALMIALGLTGRRHERAPHGTR